MSETCRDHCQGYVCTLPKDHTDQWHHAHDREGKLLARWNWVEGELREMGIGELTVTNPGQFVVLKL